MLNLPTVTVVCVDAINKDAVNLIPSIANHINFGASIFINKGINSVQDYNKFILNDLSAKVKTSHCLIVQLDGFPINPSAWTDEFLEYDYIGAPWINFSEVPSGCEVGNGGFSLRSKKLLDEVSKLHSDGTILEDHFICVKHRKYLKSVNIKYAPLELASKFSVENDRYRGQFGFHGKLTIEMNKKLFGKCNE